METLECGERIVNQVIVVGAGPGGAVLAFLLARRGVPTTLLERHTDFSREFRGEVLMPGGLEPFRQIGLWDALDAVPHVQLERFRLFANARKVATVELPVDVFGDYAPRWVSQPDLLEMLVHEAGKFPSFTLRRGAALRHLVREGERVVGVGISSNHGEEELRGDFLIGADGRSSMVRRRSGLTAVQDKLPMDIVWLKIPRPENFEASFGNEIRGYLGGGRLLLVAPTPDNKLQLGWIISKGSFGDLRKRGIPTLIDEIASRMDPAMAEHLRRHREDAVSPFLLSTVSDRLERWSAPGMLLIGDAAHTMSPVGAQGLNMAIRDAVVAANRLGPLLAQGADAGALDAAAQAVQAERSEEIVAIQKLQALPPKVMLRDVWWSRALLRLLPALARGQVRKARNEGLFGRFAWGVSEVRLEP
jgi:2-polyprenyl-6-methoxyphenol hydroxylase-like FAD-dependent oxidoreductase